eukprot:jgi/Psemu1/58926/gm1.58926_g
MTPSKACFVSHCHSSSPNTTTSPPTPRLPTPLHTHYFRSHKPSHVQPKTPKPLTTDHNAPSRNMSITDLVHLQSKCMTAGYLTYSSFPPPDTTAINTARNTCLKTLGLPSNASVHHILQTSPKIRFSYVDTHGTIQTVHSLVPWSNRTTPPSGWCPH